MKINKLFSKVEFKTISIIYILLLMILFLTSSNSINLNQNNFLFNKHENSFDEWTVGVSIGDYRIMAVTDCSGECTKISPVGTIMKTEIIDISSYSITYNRSMTFPEGSTLTPQEWQVGKIFTVPRSGFEQAPNFIPSMFHPITTNNSEYIKNYIRNTPSRNISIIYDYEHNLILNEFLFAFDHYVNYTVQIDTTTGWFTSLDLILINLKGDTYAEVRESRLIDNFTTKTEVVLNDAKNNLEYQFVTIILLSPLILISSYVLYKIRIKNQKYAGSFKAFINPNNNEILRLIYSKLVVALSRNSSFIMNNEANFKLDYFNKSHSKMLKDTTIITNLYPESMRNEISSELRGRSVLVLVEIAYQPIENKYLKFLSKALNFPQQTVAFEIKRLLDLNYVEQYLDTNTLVDTRFKYYQLTEKGILFLHLLKETIAYGLVLVQNEEN